MCCAAEGRFRHIRLVLVLPYLDSAVQGGYDEPSIRRWNPCRDDTLFCAENEWMIQRCDVLIAYVTHGWGGAARTLAYVRKEKSPFSHTENDPRRKAGKAVIALPAPLFSLYVHIAPQAVRTEG